MKQVKIMLLWLIESIQQSYYTKYQKPKLAKKYKAKIFELK